MNLWLGDIRILKLCQMNQVSTILINGIKDTQVNENNEVDKVWLLVIALNLV